MKKLRPLLPNAHHSIVERCGLTDLLGLFEASLKIRPKKAEYDLLAAAWGKLFSDLFLSAEEMVSELGQGEHRLTPDQEQMLRDFITADCRSGGVFVINVIKNGGKIDRAALIMIADLEELAGLEFNGVMAIHLLGEACDKRVRPTLIRRAGKRLLSQVYDRRGLPLVFSIFSLCDLCMDDLNAIASVFSEEELKHIMSRSRTGKSAYEVFLNVAASMKRYPSMERNATMVRNAFVIPAAKDTQKEGPERPVKIERLSRLPGKDKKA